MGVGLPLGKQGVQTSGKCHDSFSGQRKHDGHATQDRDPCLLILAGLVHSNGTLTLDYEGTGNEYWWIALVKVKLVRALVLQVKAPSSTRVHTFETAIPEKHHVPHCIFQAVPGRWLNLRRPFESEPRCQTLNSKCLEVGSDQQAPKPGSLAQEALPGVEGARRSDVTAA
ncbi:hypothetical protein AK812_SmicGene33837 [Symbiodinium microadriaticum]|uniref:Uncharacterized protein n=1 Tax=Symbiodinium microadriaticum TaxID=2951 RepID=A0A1Q9CQL3_SYMMI|nr:hypothetical protein AK812_SmicGene33837 [Symbiodinium microadriaticum]